MAMAVFGRIRGCLSGPARRTFTWRGRGGPWFFMPADFIPADNPMLERIQAVGDPVLRTDRQYVILSPVTDTDALTGFA
jgi:hypothetical protein